MNYRPILILLILATVALLFAPIDTQFDKRLDHALWNLGHIPGFALLSYASLTLRTATRPGSTQACGLWLTLTLLAGFAMVSEFAQIRLGRSFSWQDIGRDLSGIALGYTLWLFRYPPNRTRTVAVLLSTTLLALYSFAPLTIAVDEYAAHRSFPILADFCQPLQRSRFDNPDKIHLDRDTSRCYGRFELGNEAFPGFKLIHFPPNWTDYKNLVIELKNPGDTKLPIRCRINDRRHNYAREDRFSQVYPLIPGDNRLVIDLAEVRQAPEGREMKLSEISGVICFLTGALDKRELVVYKLALD